MNESDVEWFQKQSAVEKTYDIFYKTSVISIWVSILYVKHNKVINIKRFKQPIKNNKLTHSEMTALISRNRLLNKGLHKFYAMAMYNATISPQEIITCEHLDDYLTPLDQIQEISFRDTIDYINDDNELFILLSRDENQSTTKRDSLRLYNRKTLRKR